MKKLFWISIILSFFSLTQPVFASDSSLKNNKFGIHITQKEDLDQAEQLVNSNGGAWGYVTIVIQDTDKDKTKWQAFFDACREKHLIPIVRIATHLENGVWVKPANDSLLQWPEFLDSLNWPVKTRYVVIYNEPNQTKEWGNEVDPKHYARILDLAIKSFKQTNQDFFVLNAGLDQAAPNSKTTMDELNFLREMRFEVPDIFNELDGWVSHSYPNHGFVGKPWEKGRATVRGYEWELSILKNNFSLTKNLPVFITESGWPHSLGLKIKGRYGRWVTVKESFYKPEVTASYLEEVMKNVWVPDTRVIAVTPFILNYPYYPFENFSWLDKEGNPYPQFETVRQIAKTKGEPEQIEKFEVVNFSLPSFLPVNFVFKGIITLKNTGQSIWGEKKFSLKSKTENLSLSDLVLPEGVFVKPGETHIFGYTLETASASASNEVSWEGVENHHLIVFEAWKLTENKDSFFNHFLRNILNFWYNFRLGRP